ncbi:hypothetical protein TWF506_003465 [Arthrobotrys conoides]|uniref:G domain-containing protein n=1 Tax=Arthrobotrys conoides TaxID=74498 RepID=A0AAN8N7G6_9PEZI
MLGRRVVAYARWQVRVGDSHLRSRCRLHSSVACRGLLEERVGVSVVKPLKVYKCNVWRRDVVLGRVGYSSVAGQDGESQAGNIDTEGKVDEGISTITSENGLETVSEEITILEAEGESETVAEEATESVSSAVKEVVDSVPSVVEETIENDALDPPHPDAKGASVGSGPLDLPAEVSEILSYRDPSSPIPTTPILDNLPLPGAETKQSFPYSMPETCPGCGAKSHTGNFREPGFYGPEANMPTPKFPWNPKSPFHASPKQHLETIYKAALTQMSEEVKEILRESNMKPPVDEEDEPKIYKKIQRQHPNNLVKDEDVLDDFIPYENLPSPLSAESESWFEALVPEDTQRQELDIRRRARHTILCNRCRSLLHYQNTTVQGPDATFTQAAEVIAKSPFRRVHIYHIIDAADFPMSVLPNARKAILAGLNNLKDGKKKDISLSFVITRADLLMPTEQKVTSLMTYIRRVLSNYLDDSDKEKTLKDLRIVSAKNGWTTERLKDEIRGRKGGVVFIGKTNVGKSRLYEAVFPKRSKKDLTVKKGFGRGDLEEQAALLEDDFDFYIQNGKRVKYPEMPLASKVPGTTVGPIAIDFAAGRGQLIDLPGFSRGGLMKYLKQDYVKQTVMVDRVNPERYIVPPEKTFLLGGLVTVRSIQPTRGRPVTLEVAVFSNVPGHVAKGEKIEGFLNPESDSTSGKKDFLWARKSAVESFRSAGTFTLTDDVTKRRSGPLVEGMGEDHFKNVSFRVYATDIVVEGFGWLEISAQVGKDDPHPEIEVVSPDGESILQRETMKAYQENLKSGSKVAPGSRPRKSMRGAKKAQKKELRKLKSEAGSGGDFSG